MVLAAIIPPTEPSIPPRPTTEPTARRGKRSEATVNKLADQPWWAAVAMLMRATAVQRLVVSGAKVTGRTHRAQMSMAVLREALMDQPIFIRREEIQPPPTLPM